MPTYFWSGKSSSGEDVADRVEADSAEASKAIIEARGWTELQLHGNEITQHVKAGIDKASSSKLYPKLIPTEELKFLKGENPTFWGQWWKCMVKGKSAIGLIALFFACSAYWHYIVFAIFFGIALAVALFMFPVLYVWFVAPMKQFESLHRARTWWRWDEVLRHLDQLKKSQKRTKIAIGRGELARYQSLALVGQGLIEEGVALFNQEAETAEMPEWIKFSHLAVMYNVAQDFEKSLHYRRAAVVSSKEDGVACIDLAIYLVDPMRIPEEANAWLKKIETKTLPVITQSSIPLLRGLIAWRQNDFQSANAYFSEALRGKEKNAGNNRYFVFEAAILLLKARLAIVNAAMGNKQVAQRYFEECASYLSTTKRNDLIAEYEKYAGRSSAQVTS